MGIIPQEGQDYWLDPDLSDKDREAVNLEILLAALSFESEREEESRRACIQGIWGGLIIFALMCLAACLFLA